MLPQVGGLADDGKRLELSEFALDVASSIKISLSGGGSGSPQGLRGRRREEGARP